MNTIFTNLSYLVLLSILFTACKPEKPEEPETEQLFTVGKTAFIINEGTFNQGNTEISYFDFEKMSISNNFFSSRNNSALLGDLTQSMTIVGDKAYLVVNNSQKVLILSMKDFKKTGSISPMPSPRYFQQITNSKAYVTDLFSNNITIINTSLNTITGAIPLSTWSEQMLVSGSKVFVSAPLKDKVFVIDATTDAIMDSISVGMGANSMCFDKNNNIWVFCSGSSGANASLVCFNPADNNILKTIDAGTTTYSSGRICTNNAKDSIYFIKDDVYRLSINDASVSATPFISVGSSSLYGLKVKDNYVLITNAKDFVQKGDLSIYNKSGVLIKTLEAGVSPGEIVLY